MVLVLGRESAWGDGCKARTDGDENQETCPIRRVLDGPHALCEKP